MPSIMRTIMRNDPPNIAPKRNIPMLKMASIIFTILSSESRVIMPSII